MEEGPGQRQPGHQPRQVCLSEEKTVNGETPRMQDMDWGPRGERFKGGFFRFYCENPTHSTVLVGSATVTLPEMTPSIPKKA